MGPRRRRGRLGQKWMTTSLSESVRSLTATVAALELDACNLPTRSEDFEVTNDEDSSVQDNAFVAQMSMPHLSSADDTKTDDVSEPEDAPVGDSATICQQVEMHLGSNNAQEGSSDNDNNTHYGNDPEISLTPIDCATLDVLKLCHDAGVSLEFYDIIFALLRKHSSKNKVDITKLPKRETFLKSLRERISSPLPIAHHPGRQLAGSPFRHALPNSRPPRFIHLQRPE